MYSTYEDISIDALFALPKFQTAKKSAFILLTANLAWGIKKSADLGLPTLSLEPAIVPICHNLGFWPWTVKQQKLSQNSNLQYFRKIVIPSNPSCSMSCCDREQSLTNGRTALNITCGALSTQ
jgi:hypothetical protein